ncbi:hypothetical protein TWF694_006302 [Orbilia ellipsospora]|uniref:F-box domain-containing protein n=1 Tax=Orbilia ellipsospora TaxID=2528407 RepID=A0AAV9XRE6_9PEZI
MTSQTPNQLLRLPFELLHAISSDYLDNPSLKSLRTACPRGIVPVVTGSLLFRNLKLRLGNQFNGEQKLERLQDYLNGYYSQTSTSSQDSIDGNVSLGGIFQHVRKLSVDTRYPFVTTADLVSAREQHTIMSGGMFNYDGRSNGYEIHVTAEEMNLFAGILKTVFRLSKNQLISVRWQTSSYFPEQLHDEMATAFCIPETQRPYILSSSLKICVSKSIQHYLTKISHCDTLEVKYYDAIGRIVYDPKIEFIGKAVRRCERLRSFTIDLRKHRPTILAFNRLWEALEPIEMLESLRFKACNYIFPEKSPKLLASNLRRLDLIKRPYFTSYAYDEALDAFLNSLAASGTQLQRLALTKYSSAIHRFLLKQDQLEDLEIRTKSGIDLSAYMDAFWNQLIPKIQGTLKRLKVYDYDDGPFSWFDYPGNLASDRLKHCKQLEELLISFIDSDEDNKNFILEMVESLAESCPKLRTIYIKFGFGDVDLKLIETEKLLNGWESKNSAVFNGRTIDLVYDKKTYMHELFHLNKSGKTLSPLLYDYFVQKWRLVQEIDDNGKFVYRMRRMDDEYCLYS